MEISARIDPPAWMGATETVALVRALTADGATVRFVGGCVRDAVLGREAKDIDLATPDPPETVMALLKRAGLRAVPTGLGHGTITAVVEKAHYEVTTLRRDVSTDGRRAVVAFTDDWVADASRRDFTLNALYADADGAVSDPTGGIGDLRTGTVRFVGDPAQRIGEDTLRVLRYFRFHAWYGKPPVDEASYAACRAAAGDLGNLSAERVAGEALRLLAAPEPLEAVRLMAEAGVLKAVAPEARDLDSFARLLELEESIDPLLRLGMLIADGDGPGRAAALAARLRFSNADSARLKLMMEAALTVAGGVNERAARTLIYAFGNAAFEDGVQVARARAGVGEKFEPLIDLSRSWPAPTLPVRGADARALGIDKGPRVGEALRALETWWVENDFAPTREACLEKLRGLV